MELKKHITSSYLLFLCVYVMEIKKKNETKIILGLISPRKNREIATYLSFLNFYARKRYLKLNS